MAKPDLDGIAPKVHLKEAPPLTQHSGRGCLAIGLTYALFYFSGALLFWMLGSTAHRYTLNYPQLSQAQTLEEVRDELGQVFEPQPDSIPLP